MRREEEQKASMVRTTRRGLFLLGAQVGVAGVLGWRMRNLQIDQADEYLLLAEENRINIRLIPPARGLIFDRNGAPIATNKQNYRIVMIREQARDPEAVLRTLSEIVPLTESRIERALKEIRQRSAFVPVSVIDHLTWEQIAQVAANAPALPGIVTEVGLSRHYPLDGDFAHIVGYVGPVSDYDLSLLDDPDPLLQIPRFQIGKTGVEKAVEGDLRGEAGTSRIEVNSLGRVMRELSRIDGVHGHDIQLTIDAGLQNYAQRRMATESAAAVVIDTTNGDILALASAPSFDPNSFVLGISSGEYRGLNENTYRPLYNKAVSGSYPPGSTFKMVVALAALEAGEVDPSETVYCPGFMKLGNRRFHCWRRGGHGWVGLKESLKFSCDVYYYELARRVGVDRITEMANRLGLGVRPDIDVPAIAEGLTPTKNWKQAIHGESWQLGDSLNTGIGQGFVLASPLQLGVMAARLASGKKITPRLIRARAGVPNFVEPPEDMGISTRSLNLIRNGMNAVSNERRGTGYSSRIVADGLAMAGKTGTSQVRQITAAERAAGVFRNEDLPWERRDHALFVAFAPVEAPRYAIAVVVEHGGGGSRAAAPIARDIMLQALYDGTPPIEAYPSSQHEAIEEMRKTLPTSGIEPSSSDPTDRV